MGLDQKMPFEFSSKNLEAFQTMAMIGEWREQTPTAWISTAGIDELSAAFSQQKMTRGFLKRSAADTNVNNRDLLWGILAWGGMRRDAARRLAHNEEIWAKVVASLRNDNLTRMDSYRLCAETVSKYPAGGIGPAYFTKLIFFANPRHDGYIMDQWTSRSVNLLIEGAPVVNMRTSNHVNPQNSERVYEEFCQIVEELSQYLINKNAEETELCLFSTGGKSPASWRRYVMQNG